MADQHAVAAATHGGGGGHATVKTYINVAIVLAIITAVEVASLYIPGIPSALLVISLLAMSARKNQDLHRVENVGIYWHFVDIVWIFLFPLLYIAK
jgi:hypothetical protein